MPSTLDLLDLFYESTVQTIKPWSAAPPKLRGEPEETQAGVPEQLLSTSLSSQDGAEFASADNTFLIADETKNDPRPDGQAGDAALEFTESTSSAPGTDAEVDNASVGGDQQLDEVVHRSSPSKDTSDA